MRIGCCEDCQHWSRVVGDDPWKLDYVLCDYSHVAADKSMKGVRLRADVHRFGCCSRLSEYQAVILVEVGEDLGSIYTPEDFGCVEFRLRG